MTFLNRNLKNSLQMILLLWTNVLLGMPAMEDWTIIYG